MIATQQSLVALWPLFVCGILVFDAILLVFNDRLTISRATIRSKPYQQIILIIGMCFLIWHLWGN